MAKGGDGHRSRLRQRFLAAGARAFLDHEIVEMLLAQVVPRGDTKALAYALIAGAGGGAAVRGGARRPGFGQGVGAVLADPLLLQQTGRVAGFGPGMAGHLAAVREAARRLAETGESDQPVLGSWNAVGTYCRRQFRDAPVPALHILLLDYRHRLLVAPLAFAPEEPADAVARATVAAALRHAASGLIVVRLAPPDRLGEHPQDQALARRLRDGGAPVSVLLHDFIVVAGDEFLSLRSMGMLEVAALYDAAEADISHGGLYAGPETRLAALQQAAVQGEAAGLDDAELLALLLRRAVADAARGGLAEALLARFGNLGRVLSAPVDELMHVLANRPEPERPENPELTAVHLGVLGEACQRQLRGQLLTLPPLDNTAALVRYCRAALAYAEVEHLHALFLDGKQRLLWDEVLSRGTVNTAPVHPREIAGRALRLRADAIVLVHNHPTGDPQPSQADIAMTQQIDQACRVVGVEVLDHLVVAESGHVSLAEAGKMPRLLADMTAFPDAAEPVPQVRRRSRVR